MTRGEVEQKLGPPNEVLPHGLVYYGRAVMFGSREPARLTVTAFLDSFYSTGRVTRVQARCVGEEPNVVAGRVWAPAPVRWAPEAVRPVAGQAVWLDGTSTVTDSGGGFSFRDVPPGEHSLHTADFRESFEGVASEQHWFELGLDSLPNSIWIAAADEGGPLRAEVGVEDPGLRRLPQSPRVFGEFLPAGSAVPPRSTCPGTETWNPRGGWISPAASPALSTCPPALR